MNDEITYSLHNMIKTYSFTKRTLNCFLSFSFSFDSLSEPDSVRDWMPFTPWLNAFHSLTHCTPIQKVSEKGWGKWWSRAETEMNIAYKITRFDFLLEQLYTLCCKCWYISYFVIKWHKDVLIPDKSFNLWIIRL